MTAIRKTPLAPQGLWERIQAFSFDSGPATYPFWSRLAAENKWSMGFAARAISEYRRFLYLAVTAGHPVSPSDTVDQVWHLHLARRERGVLLAETLDSLPEDQRMAVELRYLGDCSLDEIAAMMDRSKPSVAGLLRRGLEDVRLKLQSIA